ncbi:MAG TPA: hypothetical protein VJJ28_00225 [Candidatus Paceibacterota bacterium]
MDINTQNSSGMMNGMSPTPNNEKKVGPIVGALIIVLILIIAALYFFGQKLNTNIPSETPSANENTEISSEQTSLNVPPNSMTATATEPDNIQSLQSDLDIQLKDVDYSF